MINIIAEFALSRTNEQLIPGLARRVLCLRAFKNEKRPYWCTTIHHDANPSQLLWRGRQKRKENPTDTFSKAIPWNIAKSLYLVHMKIGEHGAHLLLRHLPAPVDASPSARYMFSLCSRKKDLVSALLVYSVLLLRLLCRSLSDRAVIHGFYWDVFYDASSPLQARCLYGLLLT